MTTSGSTVFTSYLLESVNYGYSTGIHCNYIKALSIEADPSLQEIIVNFSNPADFKFLTDNLNVGYTTQKIYVLIQTGATLNYKPIAANWKKVDVTDQITVSGFTVGDNLTPMTLTNQSFKVALKNYNTFSNYSLSDYIQYPSNQPDADNELCFGDETFFMGNVGAGIKATAYTTDISIYLDLNEFNSSTNSTWQPTDRVAISEVGIYDENMNLVGIGKLNNPIEKDSTIARTIVFDIDF
jgi:hypothetical protein